MRPDLVVCSWLSKNVQSFSGSFLSCSDSPDACNLLMPSAPSPRRIFNAFFSGLLRIFFSGLLIFSFSMKYAIVCLKIASASAGLSLDQSISGIVAIFLGPVL